MVAGPLRGTGAPGKLLTSCPREKNGQRAIAKFPREDDDYSAVRWERVALELAAKAGIEVRLAASKRSARSRF